METKVNYIVSRKNFNYDKLIVVFAPLVVIFAAVIKIGYQLGTLTTSIPICVGLLIISLFLYNIWREKNDWNIEINETELKIQKGLKIENHLWSEFRYYMKEDEYKNIFFGGASFFTMPLAVWSYGRLNAKMSKHNHIFLFFKEKKGFFAIPVISDKYDSVFSFVSRHLEDYSSLRSKAGKQN